MSGRCLPGRKYTYNKRGPSEVQRPHVTLSRLVESGKLLEWIRYVRSYQLLIESVPITCKRGGLALGGVCPLAYFTIPLFVHESICQMDAPCISLVFYDFYYERGDLVASVRGAPLEAPGRFVFPGFNSN